jgi:organic hydroperoxide reductase OsmC/OhrA
MTPKKPTRKPIKQPKTTEVERNPKTVESSGVTIQNCSFQQTVDVGETTEKLVDALIHQAKSNCALSEALRAVSLSFKSSNNSCLVVNMRAEETDKA